MLRQFYRAEYGRPRPVRRRGDGGCARHQRAVELSQRFAWTSVRLRIAEIDAIDFFELAIFDHGAGAESLADGDVKRDA